MPRHDILGARRAALGGAGEPFRFPSWRTFQYLEALSRHDARFADFIYHRVRPEMKTALDAWLATGPLSNPNAPRTPFAMKEYRLSQDEQAERFIGAYSDHLNEAQIAAERSSGYVLMTVPFAIVSLFSGLSTRFASPGARMAIVGLALAVFISAAVILVSLPRA